MQIEASVRPRNVKRGVSNKKLCQALGFTEEVGLTKIAGRVELSATDPQDFAFLAAMFHALNPLRDEATRISIEINGKTVASYSGGAALSQAEQGK